MGNGGGRKSNSTQERPHRISIGVVGDGGAEEFIEWFDEKKCREKRSSSITGSRTSEYRKRTAPGVKIKTKRMRLTRRGCDVRLIFHDQGIDQHNTIPNKFYKSKDGLVLTFDVLNKETFRVLDDILFMVNRHVKEGTPRILVGVRTDTEQPRTVSSDEAKTFANNRQMPYHEVDYVNQENTLDAAVLDVATACWKRGRFRGGGEGPTEIEDSTCVECCML